MLALTIDGDAKTLIRRITLFSWRIILQSETRFLLGKDDYIRTQLKITYDLVIKAEMTSNKEQRVKYLLTALGNIQESLKLLGVENWQNPSLDEYK